MKKSIWAKYMYRENGDLSIYVVSQEDDDLSRLVINDKVICKEEMEPGTASGALFTVPKELIDDFFNALKTVVDDIVNKTKPNQEV